MPATVEDIRELVNLASRKDIKSVVIKKNNKNETKFKLRGARFVYSLVVEDADKAKKITQSLPPGLNVTEITTKAPKTA